MIFFKENNYKNSDGDFFFFNLGSLLLSFKKSYLFDLMIS